MAEKRTVAIRVKQEITYVVHFETSLPPHDAAKQALDRLRDERDIKRGDWRIHTLWSAESESGESVDG